MAATFGSLTDLANFEITGYWAFRGQMPRQWQSNSISVNITGLTPAERALAQDALAAWAAVANLNFTFIDGQANITFNDLPDQNGNRTAVATSILQQGNPQFLQSVTVQITTGWGGGVSLGGLVLVRMALVTTCIKPIFTK